MESKKENFSELHEEIMMLKPIFIKSVTAAINKEVKGGDLDDYLIVWKQLQNIAAPVIKDILETNFPDAIVSIAQSKSTYPDVKLEIDSFKIAIDIKSNESSKEPWFDIARLDTIINSRLKKFDEEYELVVKYDSKSKKLIKIFFDTLRATVGLKKECYGVKYRPYDGKLRPKTWGEFENNIIHWNTKEEFLQGIENSRKFRWKTLVKEYVNSLTSKEKTEFKRIFK